MNENTRKQVAMRHRTLAAFGWFFLVLAFTAPGADVESVWGGARGTLVLKSDGTVWTWGANFGGKLGLGVATNVLTRVLVPNEAHGPGNSGYLNSIKAIMGGELHNMAVKSDGTVWAWGNNMFGQLGNGTTNDADAPVQVSGLSSITSLGGRAYHALAIKADGTAWAWGWNSMGELGNGTTNPTTVPVQVVGLTNPIVVTAGYHYSVALMPDGTVCQWGHGRAIGNSNTPVQIPGFSNVTAISGGWDHALALKSDGTVWAWGLNGDGELGNGTTTNSAIPIQSVGLSNMVAVSGGDSHSSALCRDGTVWKWGLNDVGELGNGTTNSVNPVPVKILLDNYGGGFSNVVKMAARDYHNIALKQDGSVWMWGANDQGQCGDNTTNDRWRPVMVSGLGPRVDLSLNMQPSIEVGSADLSWKSSTGEYFCIEYTTNIMDGFTNIFQSNILANPPTSTVTVPMIDRQGYYRLTF